jgi:hypothetical protein
MEPIISSGKTTISFHFPYRIQLVESTNLLLNVGPTISDFNEKIKMMTH